jgi:flagellar biosynthesis GTPase FlhF
MLILMSSVVVMDGCMLMGPATGWSDTKEYHYLSQFQLPFAKNIIAYVLGKCENLVGVMVFGHKASENILPWLRDNYTKKLLIQRSNVFLSHPQNIRWRYTLKHAQHYTKMFSKIMVSLGVVIPLFVDGMLLLRCFFSKKYTLEMMEEFVDSEVLEAVRQRIAMVKIERTAKFEELKEIAVTVEGERARMAERYREEKKEKARQQEKEQVEHARQRMKEQEEHALQRKEEQEEQARQRTEEQEGQAPKARGKNKTFDNRMEDLKQYKETHGHVNVSISVDKSLAQFCAQTRYTHYNPGKSKGKQLTIENIARLDALGFIWTTQEYVTRSFDERIEDLKVYKQTHGHLSVKIHEDNSLFGFCKDVRHSLKQVEKDCTRKLTVERIQKLDDIGFTWNEQYPHKL